MLSNPDHHDHEPTDLALRGSPSESPSDPSDRSGVVMTDEAAIYAAAKVLVWFASPYGNSTDLDDRSM